MNNRRLKLLASALDLNRKEIAEIVTFGGVDTSSNQADSWLRSASSTKQPTGNSSASRPIKRHHDMSDEAFDAFCLGLKEWLHSNQDPI